MTLTTHALVAAAAAKPLIHSHPAFIFLAALASHYLADAIPHWDYRLHSQVENGEEKGLIFTRATFWPDFMRAGFDFAFGLGVLAAMVWPTSIQEVLYVLLAVVGGTLPDLLQAAYYGFHIPFLKPHQRFHDWIHTRIKLGPYPLLGVPLQLIIMLMALLILA